MGNSYCKQTEVLDTNGELTINIAKQREVKEEE